MTNFMAWPARGQALSPAILRGGDRWRVYGGRRVFVSISLTATVIATGPLASAQSTAAVESVVPGGNIIEQKFVRLTGDVLRYELLPSVNATFKAAPFRTNRWGMRDKDYALKRPMDTYRIALLGSSFSMGGGVPVEQTFEWLLENRLNREGPGAPRRHYEILNFSVGGYGILQNVVVAEKKVFPFAPSAVFVVIHSIEGNRITNHVISLLRQKIPIEYPYLLQKFQEAGVRPGMRDPELRRRLGPVSSDLVTWSYRRIAQLCREQGVPLVGIAFSEPGDARADQLLKIAALAADAGIPVLTLGPVYSGHSLDSVTLRSTDLHLSALGHRLVADRLYQLIRDNARTLKLGFVPVR